MSGVGPGVGVRVRGTGAVSYTHLRAHETVLDLVCRLLLEKKKNKRQARQKGDVNIGNINVKKSKENITENKKQIQTNKDQKTRHQQATTIRKTN